MNKPNRSSELETTRLQRILMFIPVAALVIVALNQPRLHAQDHLSSWKGGGFGMFATLDRHTTRPFVVTFKFRDRTMQLDFRSYGNAIGDDVDKQQHLQDTAALPNAHNLRVLAQQIAELKYIVDTGEYAIASTNDFGIPISVMQITIDIYRIQYDDATNRVSFIPMLSWPEDFK